MKKLLLYRFFFMTRCLCGNYQLMWREEENIFYREVDVVKNKNWEDVTVDSCRQKPDVLSSIQGLRKLVKAYSVCICFVKNIITQHFPGFLFLCFRSCCFLSLMQMSMRLSFGIYIYIYISIYFFLKFRS